jgi:hypothetical protein
MTRAPRLPSTLAALGLCLLAAPARAQEGEPPPAPPPGSPASPAAQGAPPAGGPSNTTDESQDSGLGLEWVYINADVGYTYVDFASMSSTSLGLAETAGSGLTWGAGAGVRLFVLSAGARVRNTLLSNPGSLWTLDLEAALHMRIWHIDPYFGVRGGYAWVGSFSTNAVNAAVGTAQPNVDIHGFDVSPMLGMDLYFTSLISVGVEGTGQFLFLTRPKVALPDLSQLPPAQRAMVQMQIDSNPLYQASGSSVGFGGGVTAHLGIHF